MNKNNQKKDAQFLQRTFEPLANLNLSNQRQSDETFEAYRERQRLNRKAMALRKAGAISYVSKKLIVSKTELGGLRIVGTDKKESKGTYRV